MSCIAGAGVRTDTGGSVPPVPFAFTIAGPERESLRDFPPPDDGAGSPFSSFPTGSPLGLRSAALAESLPPDFPNIQASVFGTPSPGRLFVSDLHFNIFGIRIPSYLLILENSGSPYFYRQLPWTGLDFKMQPDGRLRAVAMVVSGAVTLDAQSTFTGCQEGRSLDSQRYIAAAQIFDYAG